MIKPYAEEVLKVIRQYDPDNLVIVGTPHWSQEVDVAARKPILDTNIAYAFHFYSSDGWHKQNLRDKVLGAMKKGAPIFITEYGLSEADGNGAIDTVETAKADGKRTKTLVQTRRFAPSRVRVSVAPTRQP